MKISSVQTRVFVIVVVAFVAFSCGSKADLASHIPKDATVVMTADVKSMALKSVDFKQLLTFDNFKKFMGRGRSQNDSVAASIANSGLDFASTVYVFGQVQETSKYGAVIAGLSDAKGFEAFLQATDKTIVIKEESGLKFAKIKDDQGIIAWNDKVMYAVYGDPIPKERVLSLVNLKKEESLADTNDSFKASQKEGGDISLWVNFTDVVKAIPQYAATMQNMNMENTFFSAVCNFEDGKVVVDTKYSTNPTMAGDKLMKSSINGDIVRMLPGDSVIALMGFALDMPSVYKQLDKQNVVQPYEPMAKQFTGLSIAEILNIFTGDFVMSVNGVEMKDVSVRQPFSDEMVTRKQPSLDYSVVVGIADKEKLFKLLDQFVAAGFLSKKDNFYTFQDKVFVFEKGPAAIITASEVRVKAFSVQDKEKLDPALASLLEANCTTMYFDPTKIPDDAYGKEGTSARENILNSEVVSVTIKATSFKDNVSTGEFVVKFKNEKENSLVTIARVSKKMKTDNTFSPAPADTTAAPNF